MATPKILIKRSNVAGRVPTSLDSGELALNTADGKIYYTGHDGAIHAFIDSAGVNTLINNSVSTLDSGNVTDMIDSDYIQARQITYTIPTLGNDFVDSAQVQAIINAAYVKNIIDSAYVAGIVETDGDITITITNEITSTVDSAYVQARVDATDFLDSAEAIALIDSAHVRGKIDTTFINSLNVNSTTLDGENGDHYLDYNNFTNTPTILDNIDVQNQIDSDYVQLRQEKFDTSDFTDSAYVKARIDSAISDLIGGAPEALNTLNELAEALNDDSAAFDTLLAQIDARLDSAEATALIDSAYIRARQIKYLDSDAVKLITLDSSEIPGIVDQAYVRARQDFRYSELSGTPTSLSDFSNDILATTDDLGEGTTNLYFTNDRVRAISLDSEDATNLIDSAYIQARQAAAVAEGTDSATVRDIIDSHGNSKFLRLEGGTLTGHLNVDGSNKIYFNDSDGFIGWTGSLLNIRQNNASLRLTNNSFQLVNTSSLGLITADTNSVGLRYAGNTKLQTETDGVTVTGTLNNHTLPGGTGGTYALTSDIPTVPTNVSDFTNDANYLDSTTVQDVIDSAYVLARAPSQDFLDSSEAIALIDSAHVQARQITYSNADFLDSNTIEGVVDSAYVQLRQTAQDFSYTSLTDVPDLFDSSDAETLIDSAYVQLRQTAQDFAYSSLTDAPTTVSSFTNDANYLDSTTVLPLIPKFGTDYVDSSTVIDIINSEGLDSDLVIALVDSAYIQLRDRFQDSSLVTSTVNQTYIRDRETPNPVLGTDFVDSAEALKLIDANALDSARAISLIDSAYVQLRQDYAYGSLTGTPTIPAFGTDFVDSAYVDGVLPKFGTDYVDSAFVTSQGYITSSSLPVLGTDFVDSAEALKLIDANALDSARATSLIDSAYIELRRPPETIFGVTNNGASAYTFNGDGFSSGRDNPDLYLQRGKTYKFEVAAIGHPFQIRSSAGGMAYNNGVTNNGSENDNVFFTPDMNAPDTLVYQCTNHASMVGTIYIVDINTFVDSAYVEGVLPKFGTDYVDSAFVTGQGYITSSSLPVLGTDFIDSAEALKLIDANALDSARAITLIDSAYIQARQTAGTDSAATIALIEATVDSAYVQARQTAGGGGDGTVDSAQTIALIQSTVDSAYIQLRVDSDYEKPIEQQIFIYTADSGQTTFADSDDNGNVLSFTHHQQVTIYLNGLLLSGTGDATIDNSTDTITLTDAADSGDIVTIVKLSGSKPHIDSSMINNIDLQLITYVFTADSNESAFEGTDDRGNTMILSGNERVSINGILLLDSDDYSVLNNKVTLVSATDSGDIVTIERFKGRDAALDSSLIANTELIFTTFKFTADSGDTVFTGADDNGNTLSYSSGKVRVHLNGILLIDSDDYTATSNTTLTLTQSTNTGDIVTIEKMSGRDVGLDSAGVRLIVDSAYIQARQVDLQRDSAFVTTIIDSAYINARTEAGTDSAATIALINANALDSGEAISLIDSTYVQARQITYTIPTLGNDFIDSAEAIKLITANAIDSGVALELLLDSIETIALIDSAYVRQRVKTDQDLLTTSNVTFNTVTADLNGAIEFTAKNAEGSTLTKGTVVYISGVSGNNPTVAKADASDPAKMPAFGIVAEDANDNANTIVFTFGTLYNLDTSAFDAGDTLFVSTTAGELTNVKPAGESNLLQNIGRVIRSHGSAGSIKVGGAGRTNATPNLDNDQFFLGNDSNYAVAVDFTTTVEGVVDSAYVNSRIDFDSTSANQIIAMNSTNTGFVSSGMIYNSTTQSLGIGVDSAGSIDARLHIVGTGTANTGETLFKVNNSNDHDRIEFIDENTSTSMPSALRIKLPTEGMGIISETGPVRIFQGGSTTSDVVARFHSSGNTFNDAYKFPNADGTTGQFLKTNGEGVLSFDSVAAGQSLALGTDYVDSAQVELIIDSSYVRGKLAPTFTFGSNDSATVADMQVTNRLSLGGAGSQFFAFNEDTVKVKFANWYSSNDRQYGMGQLWYETFIAAIDEYNLGPEQRRIGFYLEVPDAGASDTENGSGKHPSNARMYISDSGMHVSYSNPFRLNESGGPNYIELAGAQTLASNVTLTLPTTTGTLARTADIPALGADFIDSNEALILIDANALDSGRATSLIDSAYVQARQTSGLSDIVNDTTPQLGGNLDGNGFDIFLDDDDILGWGGDPGRTNIQGKASASYSTNYIKFNVRTGFSTTTEIARFTEDDGLYTTIGLNFANFNSGINDYYDLKIKGPSDGSLVANETIRFPDSSGTVALTKDVLDSADVIGLIPTLGTDFIDSDQALILIDANALDSGRATSLIDSAYIELRRPPETIFNVVNNGASAYTFTGDGFSSGRDNPDLYLQRGKTYKFAVAANGHPFQIRSSAGGSAYNNGVTNNGSENDNVFFTPDMNAPDTLVYQCTNHGSMVGTIYIVDINTFVDSSYVTDALPVLGTDFIDSAQALILIDANALDSGRATALIDSAYIQSRQTLIDSALTTSLIDSAYIQARQTAGTDSAATIALIESTVDSAYVQLREAAGGGSGGTDSAAVITLIQQTVDSSYVQVRETSGVVSSTASIGHFIYTADSGQTAFTGPDDYGNTLSYTANSNNISVFLNGILQLDSVDFTETSNSTVTLPAVDSGDIVSIVKYTLTSASELDSAEVIQLIDSDYIQARQTAGTDSAATISLVEATVDSAYVQARQSGSTGLDSAQSLALFSAHGMTVNTFVYTADSIGKLVYEGTDDNLNVMSFTKASKNFRVSLNGILLIDSDDFTAVDNKITLINAPNVNDILAVETFSGTQGVGGMSTFRYTATNGQLTFSGSDVNGASLNYKPGDLIVSLNGITLIDSAEYTATDGTSIVLNDSAAVNDELLISTFTPDIERKWTERSTSISVGSNTKNIIDCSSGSVTLTFPSNPTFGDEIRVIDGTGNASTNNIIINRNGNNIQGAADNFIIDIDRAGVGFVYYNATNGWILIEN